MYNKNYKQKLKKHPLETWSLVLFAIVWLTETITQAATCSQEPALQRFEYTQKIMAVPVRIVLYAPNQKTANISSKAAFSRIEFLDSIFSDYNPKSELSRLNNSSGKGKAVKLSPDLWKVLSQAQNISAASNGAFDISVGPVVHLWRAVRLEHRLQRSLLKLHNKHHQPNQPEEHNQTFPMEQIQKALDLVDYKLIELNPKQKTAKLLKPGMRLDLGGIAKGYATEEALKILRKSGIKSALVDAGGDITLGDSPPGRPGWMIGIAKFRPMLSSAGSPGSANRQPTHYLWLSDVSVATSGDTWQFIIINGKRYSHIVNPRTGLGLTDHSMVTIISKSGMIADALASAVSVLGPEKGIELVENYKETAARIVRAPNGREKAYESRFWKKLPDAKPAR